MQKVYVLIRYPSKYRLLKLGTKLGPERSLEVRLTTLYLPLNKTFLLQLYENDLSEIP